MRRFRAVRALLLQGRALHHTETVLLIRHNQSEPLIRHLFTDQRVRPEHCLIFPVCASLLRLPLRLRAHRANQQTAVDAQRFQHCLGGFVVLARENFRRRHHRRLVSAGAGHGNRPERQRGFAAADIPLNQRIQALPFPHLLNHGIHGILLVLRELIWQVFRDFLYGAKRFNIEGAANTGASCRILIAHGEVHHIVHQKSVVSLLYLRHALREMYGV